MKLIDVTRPIFANMTIWPGDDGVVIERTANIEYGDIANTSRICAGSHTGTHVDAPLHFIADGKSIDQLDISLFTGTVTVIEVADTNCITGEFLKKCSLTECKAVFFKTWFSDRSLSEPFDKNYPGLDPDAAEYIVKSGIRVVGIDTLSVEKYYSKDFAVHKILLGSEVLIIEGLCLKNIIPGKYKYICMPLPIKGSDGAPARVMLVDGDE